MIKKVALTCICVFLAVVLIGAVTVPNSSFQGVVNNLKRSIKPVISAIDSAKSILLPDMSVEMAELSNEFISSEKAPELIFNKLNEFVPYHLRKYDLVSRCSNQGISVFTYKNEKIHEEHKIALLYMKCFSEATDGYDSNYHNIRKWYSVRIFYCGVCDKVCAYCCDSFDFSKEVSFLNWLTGDSFYYPYDFGDVFTEVPVAVSNEFWYYEFTDYFNDLN